MNQFPYTNFHELNLDWIMKQIRDAKPLVITWEGTNRVEEDSENPGTYVLITTFPEAFNHIEAFKQGATVILHFPEHTYMPESFIHMAGVSYTNPAQIIAGITTLVFDTTTDTVTLTTPIN